MKFLLIIMAAFFLNGCSVLGLNTFGIDPERIDTVNKQLAVRITEADGFTTLTRSLLAQEIITASQAKLVSAQLETVYTLVSTANAALAASGDPTKAENLLDQVNSAIGIALDLLNTFAPRETALHIKPDEGERENHVFNSWTTSGGQRYKLSPPRHASFKRYPSGGQLAFG